MKTPYEMVLEFHQTFRLLPPPPNFEAIRRKMIRDEAEELLTADTPEKMHDWICDMIYFIQGGFVEIAIVAPPEPLWFCKGPAHPSRNPHLNTRTCWLEDIQFILDEAPTQNELLLEVQQTVEEIAHEIGYPMADFKKDFAQVHAANMRKVWTSNDLLHRIALFDQHHQEKDGSYTSKDGWNYLRIDGTHWIVKHEGKIQKPPGWSLEGGAE